MPQAMLDPSPTLCVVQDAISALAYSGLAFTIYGLFVNISKLNKAAAMMLLAVINALCVPAAHIKQTLKKISKAIRHIPKQCLDAYMGAEWVRACLRAKLPASALYACRVSASMFCTAQCSTSYCGKTAASPARCWGQCASRTERSGASNSRTVATCAASGAILRNGRGTDE
eukprot:1195336-Prorocentrum_minimum.AAC.3